MLNPVSSRPEAPAGYGIAPAAGGAGLLDWSWAEERLVGRHIWWLATTRPDGRPHVMPVWAVWLGDGVGFSTSNVSRKAKNVARNPRVTIVPERGAESVIVEGVVEPLPVDRMADFNRVYLEVYEFDVSTMDEPVNIVRPTTVFGFIDIGDQFAKTATRWSFD